MTTPRRQKHYFTPQAGYPPLCASVRHRVLFSEVDALAIGWHGRYPAFFELAHTELCRKCDLSYSDYSRAGIAAPVAQLHVDYFKPVKLDDEITITASLFRNDAARLDIEYSVLDSSGALCASGYTVQTFIDAKTGDALWCPPQIWLDCLEKWEKVD